MSKDRMQEIIKLLGERESLSVEDAEVIFGISPATARRDFNALAEANIARRIRGGLRRIHLEANPSIPLSLREQWHSAEKERLARKAMEYVKADSVVFIHGGTTTSHLGMFLESGTVISNSIGLAEILGHRFPGGGGPELLLAGGRVDFKAGILLGSVAERAIANYRADLAIFSSRGFDEEGVMDSSDATAGIQRAMVDRAAFSIMLADHSKYGMKALCKSLEWSQVDVLISSASPENLAGLEAIRAKGVQVVLV